MIACTCTSMCNRVHPRLDSLQRHHYLWKISCEHVSEKQSWRLGLSFVISIVTLVRYVLKSDSI